MNLAYSQACKLQWLKRKNRIFCCVIVISASFLPCWSAARAEKWMAGETVFETSEKLGQQKDRLYAHVAGMNFEYAFERSRGPADIIAVAFDGSLRMPGVVLSWPWAGAHRIAPVGWQPVDFNSDVEIIRNKLTVRRGSKTCTVSMPRRYKFEATTTKALPRDVATSNLYLLVLATKAHSGKVSSIRISMKDCSVAEGDLVSPKGFDSILQSNGQQWLLASSSSASVQISANGLHWTDVPLPPLTHVLMAAYVDACDTLWSAVSAADENFSLIFYFKRPEEDSWQKVGNAVVQIPTDWIEGQRLAQQATQTGSSIAGTKVDGSNSEKRVCGICFTGASADTVREPNGCTSTKKSAPK